MEGSGPNKAESSRTDASTLLVVVSEGKMHREDKGTSVPEWSSPTCVHPKGRGGIAHGLDRINFHHCIDWANKRRKVRCYDMPSAFVNTDMDEDILMVLKGELAEMMVQIASQVYRKYIMVDRKGTKILYVKLQKALYGLMRASLLFYLKLKKEFEAYGLEVNPYNPCMAKMMTKSGK
jgi:hypothetical protein